MGHKAIGFFATGRSGLGHLRRVATIAGALRDISPDLSMTLLSNAAPDALSCSDLAAFDRIIRCDRPQMVETAATRGFDLAVLDTMRLPGIDAVCARRALILRETPDDRLTRFAPELRPWDLVVIPNPGPHWWPRLGPGFAHRVAPAGWIVRRTGPRRSDTPGEGILVATGGGGTEETRALLYPMLERVIGGLRDRVGRPILIRQAMGPRSAGMALNGVDEVFDPGSRLNERFRAADLVLSTAGYNSVLELATTDTPALLAAIPRSHDDQMARVRHWGPKLGCGLEPDDPEGASDWLAGQIRQAGRRPPVHLDLDGAARAAELLSEAM